MNIRRFSIVEISVVISIILILMLLCISLYKSVQRSVMIKNQLIEFENIKIAIHTYKTGISKSKQGFERHVNIFDLVFKYRLITQKRILLVGGNDVSRANEKIISYFGTPIEVFVTKQRLGASSVEIEAGFKKISKKEFLTGDFEFYFGKEHEVDGGEQPPAPTSTPYGLIGTGTSEEANQYTYKLVFYLEDDPKSKKVEYILN